MHRVPLNRAVIAAAVGLLVLPFVLPSVLMATEVAIFFLATLGCTLLIGQVNILSFAQGAFFGIGAYVAALLMIHLGFGLGGALAAGALAAMVAGLAVGVLCMGRRGFYLVMLTVAFAQLAYLVAYAASGWTGGENGLIRVPRPPLDLPALGPVSLSSPGAFYAVTALATLAGLMFLERMAVSPFGTALRAIGENEERAQAVGYNVNLFRIAAFAVSALVTGLAGGLYAMFLNFVPLAAIDLSMNQTIVVICILGGTRSLLGAFLGAAFYVVGSSLLSSVWPHWPLILGVILIASVTFVQGGLAELSHRLVAGLSRGRRERP